MGKTGIIVMQRQQLYDEIWKISVSGVAKKYHLNYPKLIAACKRENIPFPSSGYWTKLKLGKDVSDEIVMLPKAEKTDVELLLNVAKTEKTKYIEEECGRSETAVEELQKNDGRKAFMTTDKDMYDKVLQFFPLAEQRRVIEKALSLKVSAGGRLHPVLLQYKQSVERYKKQLKEAQDRNYYNPRIHSPKEKPLFVTDVSDEGIKRIIAILDAVFKAVESLGGYVDTDLSVKIKNDYVKIRFTEGQDKVKHELTKREARELLEYSDAMKNNRYASKPQIRKWDNVYNGKLRIAFGSDKYIRDTAEETLEERLGDILIALYEKAEENRIDRERREEEWREYQEEVRRKEEQKKRRDLEIQRTKELCNKAEDYRIACDIRAYIAAAASSDTGMDAEWLSWAKRKADWYDPVVALEDDFFGKREHEKSKDEKI